MRPRAPWGHPRDPLEPRLPTEESRQRLRPRPRQRAWPLQGLSGQGGQLPSEASGRSGVRAPSSPVWPGCEGRSPEGPGHSKCWSLGPLAADSRGAPPEGLCSGLRGTHSRPLPSSFSGSATGTAVGKHQLCLAGSRGLRHGHTATTGPQGRTLHLTDQEAKARVYRPIGRRQGRVRSGALPALLPPPQAGSGGQAPEGPGQRETRVRGQGHQGRPGCALPALPGSLKSALPRPSGDRLPTRGLRGHLAPYKALVPQLPGRRCPQVERPGGSGQKAA